MKDFYISLDTYLIKWLKNIKMEWQVRRLWLAYYNKNMFCSVKRRLPMLEFIFMIVEIEHIYGITFYASEFRRVQNYHTLLTVVKGKINEKDRRKKEVYSHE